MQARQTFVFVEPSGRREAASRWRNPDGTIGGWVAVSAQVHPTAVVELDALVEPGAVVGPATVVKNGTVILGPLFN